MKYNFSKKGFRRLSVLFIVFVFYIGNSNAQFNKNNFDKQAHRGGRGLMPENTIQSEKNAINFDCTLEMDLQMTKDKQIVVSHDPYFNALFCLTPEGDTMSRKDGLSRLIYNMNYDSVKQYETGLKPYAAFQKQAKIHAYRPLLSDLIDSVEDYAKQKNHTNYYNIEIKSNPKSDGKYYSDLKDYIHRAMQIIISKGIAKRVMMQSFDVRALRIIHEEYPAIQTSYLVDAKNRKNAENYINELGFTPNIFSPEYSLVNKSLIDAFHQKNVLVIPWTPDTLEEIQNLVSLGVDGVITDYPDLFSSVKFN